MQQQQQQQFFIHVIEILCAEICAKLILISYEFDNIENPIQPFLFNSLRCISIRKHTKKEDPFKIFKRILLGLCGGASLEFFLCTEE